MNGCKIKNNSNLRIDDEIHSLVDFAQSRFGFERPPTIFLNHDKQNSQKTLAKTGYYNPETLEIHIYATGRHPKDILRSIAHELVHHFQNEQGQFSDMGDTTQGYAQKDPHLRNMELQANDPMLFRDWEDHLKENNPTIYNEGRNKKMSLKEWKDNELNRLLMKKFGIIKEVHGAYIGGSSDQTIPPTGMHPNPEMPSVTATRDEWPVASAVSWNPGELPIRVPPSMAGDLGQEAGWVADVRKNRNPKYMEIGASGDPTTQEPFTPQWKKFGLIQPEEPEAMPPITKGGLHLQEKKK